MRAAAISPRDDSIERSTQRLITQFKRQRPLRGGSLIVTIFGDSIAPRGGEVSLGSLIRLAAPFGLTERLVRTSVGRLAKEGWLESQRRGRLSYYRLSATGRTRFAEATLRIYGEAPQRWSGEWTLLLMGAGLGRRRDSVRAEMMWLGFGQLLPGLLAHPTHDLEDTRARLAELGVLDEVTLMGATVVDPRQQFALIATGWDLDELARRYRRFVASFAPVAAALATGGTLSAQTGFILRTLLIHEYRKIHLRDPLLPQSLLPADWIGNVTYELCRSLYARVFAPAEVFLSQQAQTARGPLPPTARETLSRFGGLEGQAEGVAGQGAGVSRKKRLAVRDSSNE